nr:uncharacterized protein LOC106677617 [Halyomorpha halys]
MPVKAMPDLNFLPTVRTCCCYFGLRQGALFIGFVPIILGIICVGDLLLGDARYFFRNWWDYVMFSQLVSIGIILSVFVIVAYISPQHTKFLFAAIFVILLILIIFLIFSIIDFIKNITGGEMKLYIPIAEFMVSLIVALLNLYFVIVLKSWHKTL